VGSTADATAGIVLEGVPGSVLHVAFGNGQPKLLEGPVSLAEVSETASVGASERVVCDPTGRVFWGRAEGGCVAHVRIWRVHAPDQLATEAVDPAIRDRLRALGYSW
jgi:hypothetical protein